MMVTVSPCLSFKGLDGVEVNLHDTFQALFRETFGGGYPKERREPEQRNKKLLDVVKLLHTNH